MAVDVFAHSFVVAAAPGEVRVHLADPHSYVGLSPLVVAVRDVRRDGDVVRYVAVERFGLYRNAIRVTMTVGEARIVSEVVSPGRVRLRAEVDLAPHGDAAGHTAVTETITVRSPALLRRFVVRQARGVQQSRALELTRRFA
ncbi:SRPBCC family protein [Dactylosporangium sp. NPDC048998]|uniref:SRPBCC family protein n=1 Tax=Dactylosporangium sp. NPDC048998 TaxID=3363976 RepID=UPI0037105ADB